MDAIHPLRAYRERQNPPLSQKQLADRLGIPGPTLSRWENGERKPEPDLLSNITAKTGIAAGELRPDLARLFGTPPKRPLRRLRRKVRAA